MTVLTGFHRVGAETIERLEANPELMDGLLGGLPDAAAGERLGLRRGIAPPYLNIGSAWDEILILLAGTDHHAAYQALHISVWEDYDGCEEIRLFSPALVKKGLAALEDLEIDELRRAARRRRLRAYDGAPFDELLEDALDCFESLRDFWRAAARAGEGIVSETG
ncbi:MAG TPA: DUF1877 family protein [Pyrinomonadaceae bacterium]|jgi:hypothetical protein